MGRMPDPLKKVACLASILRRSELYPPMKPGLDATLFHKVQRPLDARDKETLHEGALHLGEHYEGESNSYGVQAPPGLALGGQGEVQIKAPVFSSRT